MPRFHLQIIYRYSKSIPIAVTLFLIGSHSVYALKIEPGVGAGVEYTDNAALTETQEKADTIAIGYVGVDIEHKEGPFRLEAVSSFNKHVYMQDTFADQRYFNLNGVADWEAVKNRFHLVMRDTFSQTPVVSTGTNQPNNIQDANIFTFGANWKIPVSEKTEITLVPEYRKFYYEVLDTDNKQYTIDARLFYRMYRLTNVGLNASLRQVDYEFPSVADTGFKTLHITIDGQRARSKFTLNLGATNVSRDGGESFTGFSGKLSWRLDMSSRSKVKLLALSELTDTSTGRLNTSDNQDFNNVQITTDVIRNKLLHLDYIHKGDQLKSRLWGELREVTYSDSPNDRRIKKLGLDISYPVTALLTSGFYSNYSNNDLTQQDRIDKQFSAGFDFSYQHTRKLRSVLDIKYRNKDSSAITSSFTETAVFYSLVYGYGNVYRPTRAGGF